MTETADDTRACPRCAETIKAAAVVCRFCGAEFDAGGALKAKVAAEERAAAQARRSNAGPGAIGCLVLLVFVVVFGVGILGRSARSADTQAVLVPTASGEHCLDASIGGLNADLWFAVKHTLHDPASMTDMRMSIRTVSPDGTNGISFMFRAKNVYGALQLNHVEARVSNANCKLVDWQLV